jgi:ATPase family associated with various cellular activities (AAA)
MNDFLAENQSALAEAISRVRARVGNTEPPAPAEAAYSGQLLALDILVHGFRLTPFERDLLVLATAAEIDGLTGILLMKAGAEPRRPSFTFSMALQWLDEPHWTAFSPSSPLRRWRLLEVNPAESLMHSPVHIDERVLHFLMGVPAEDDRISSLLRPCLGNANLPDVHRLASIKVGNALASEPRPIVQICGAAAECQLVAAAVAESAEIRAMILSAADLPASAAEREALARLLEREVLFSRMLPLLVVHDAGTEVTARAVHFADCLEAPLCILSSDPLPVQRPSKHFDIGTADPAAQRALWNTALGPRAASLNGSLDHIVRQFHFDASRIASTAARLPADTADAKTLWQLCRNTARQKLDALAQRIESTATWDDLVLPAPQLAMLRDLAAQAANRYRVYEEWGFAQRTSRGLGISALFAGPSGTGKTLAAEVLAGELQLDLYRIDLSATVSKWLGETEKNLSRIFDAAEAGGAILLIDEADALFGKRSEVKDSRDRYANMEVSYLLQRMEAYRGLAILTTNQREALDHAFMRRLRFVVNFSVPDISQRQAIWQRVFPSSTPVSDLHFDQLAKLSVTGGVINNIALNAAFSAAAENQPVRMGHLLHAAKSEAAKSDRQVNIAEIGDWI